jgi:photosystem I P700 chlorophyll a apoprotein A1
MISLKCIILWFPQFWVIHIHNDTLSALGRPADMFSDTAIQLQLNFCSMDQKRIS